MEEELGKTPLQVTDDGENLIDFSSENDALILDLPSPLSANNTALRHHHQSSEHKKEPKNFDNSGPLDAGKEATMTPSSDQDEQLPYLTESTEPERVNRIRKCNLRKSLAWDSAFFTSAGVLDPEELSSMITGTGKSENKTLPGIQEDIRRSNDSISTLESDNLTLESLEAELFEDIRASIQKSSKMFNMTVSGSGKVASGKCEPISSMKKIGLASQDQLKQRSGPKKPIGAPKSEMKQTLKVQGPLKAVKRDTVHSQVAQLVARAGDSIATLPKPPRTICKGQPISTEAAKRASLGATKENKIENDKTRLAAGRGPQASKVPAANGACRILPKPASSLKSSSLGSSKSTKTESARSYLSNSSRSVSSEHIGKSSLATARRKVCHGTVNPPSSSTHKTPLKSALRNRTTGNSAIHAYVMSSKISSSTSPASSVSEWSSASSTSSSTINQRCNKSRTSFDTSSCKSLDNEILPSDLDSHPNNEISDGHGSERIAMQDASTSKSSTETGKLSKPGFMKPSGLRMPSPKIGFFDGLKSVRTPNGTMQSNSSVPAVLPKLGDAVHSPHRSSSMKAKMSKLPQARTLSSSASAKPSSPTQRPSSPMTSEEKLHAFSVPSVSPNDKENGIGGGQAHKLEGKSGNIDSYTCNFENLDEKLEPRSISLASSASDSASRNPLVAMNAIPISDYLDQSQRTGHQEN